MSTQTHAYQVLCEQFKLVADRFMYAASSVDKAMAKREMEGIRGKIEFEAMAMQIRSEERFNEAAWMHTYETEAEKVALMKMRRGSNTETRNIDSDSDDPEAGPSTRHQQQPPTPLPKAQSSVVPNPVPLVAPMFTAEQMAQLKQEMGQFLVGMMQQCVQQVPQNTVPALPQIKQETESDCEVVEESDSSMHTAVAVMAATNPATANDGMIVTSTPDNSDDELVIDEKPDGNQRALGSRKTVRGNHMT